MPPPLPPRPPSPPFKGAPRVPSARRTPAVWIRRCVGATPRRRWRDRPGGASTAALGERRGPVRPRRTKARSRCSGMARGRLMPPTAAGAAPSEGLCPPPPLGSRGQGRGKGKRRRRRLQTATQARVMPPPCPPPSPSGPSGPSHSAEGSGTGIRSRGSCGDAQPRRTVYSAPPHAQSAPPNDSARSPS